MPHRNTVPLTADLELLALFDAAPRGARSAVAKRLRVSPGYITRILAGKPVSAKRRGEITAALAEVTPLLLAVEEWEAGS